MFWQEDEDKETFEIPKQVIDLSFAIRCKQLPLDHAWALKEAITQELPWLTDTSNTGIHAIHVAESGNGWTRPDDTEHEWLIPSRRTKLVLRIPYSHLEQAQTLTGKTLNIAGQGLTLGKSKEKTLLNASVIFARHIISHEQESEPEFLARIATAIKSDFNFKVKKMMCGKSHYIQTSNTQLFTRHLMIADLDNETSIAIQERGLGEERHLGCGIFLPHKGIKTLNPSE